MHLITPEYGPFILANSPYTGLALSEPIPVEHDQLGIQTPAFLAPRIGLHYAMFISDYLCPVTCTPHANPPQFFFPRSTASPLDDRTLQFPTQPEMDEEKKAPGKARKKSVASNNRKSLSCEFCSRPFARLEHLQRHLRTREWPWDYSPAWNRAKAILTGYCHFQIRKKSRFRVNYAPGRLRGGKRICVADVFQRGQSVFAKSGKKFCMQ